MRPAPTLAIFALLLVLSVPAVHAVDYNRFNNVVASGYLNVTGATYLGNSKCAAGQVLTSNAATGLLSCTADSGAGYQSSAGGWTNDSTTTSTSLNVDIDSNTLYVNSADNKVGIGTNSPDATVKLHVSGGYIGLDNNQAISWKSNAGTMSTVIFFDANDALSVRGLTGGFKVLHSGGGENMRITNAGDMGFGTAAPVAKMHVQDGALLFNGTTGNTPTVSGAGTRMMWIPAKAAFRAGTVNGSQWDDANIGTNSVAMGNSTIANATGALAIGDNSWAYAPYSLGLAGGNGFAPNAVGIGSAATAGGNYSVSIGAASWASMEYTSAIGYGAYATAPYATAIGYGASANGPYASAIGPLAWASNYYSVALGVQTVSAGAGSFAVGGMTNASGNYASAFGYASKAVHYQSFAAGYNTTAGGYRSTVFGDTSIANGSYSFAAGQYVNASADSSFVLGRGVSATSMLRSTYTDSFMVGFGSTTPTLFANGTFVGVGTATPAERFAVQAPSNNDARAAIIAGGEANNAILYFGTPYLGTPSNGLKAAIIAQGQSTYSRSKLHFSLDNSGANGRAYDANLTNVRMTIQNDGNVGIGTTSPARLLHLNSSGNTYLAVQSSGTGATGYPILELKNAYNKTVQFALGSAGSAFENQTYIYDASASAMRWLIDNNGKVGIGTASPSYPVDILYTNNAGGIAETGLRVRNTQTFNSAQINLNSSHSWSILAQGTGGAPVSGFSITDNVANAARLSIDTSGNVGIGTTSPNTTLSISSASNPNIAGMPSVWLSGDANKERIIITSTSASVFGAYQNRGSAASPTAIQSGDALGFFQLGGYNGSQFSRAAWISGVATENWGGTSWGGAMTFSTVANSTGTAMVERMRINENGNVGIGTTAPGAKLEINTASAASVQEGLRILNPNTGAGGAQILIGQFNSNYAASIETVTWPASYYGASLWLRSRNDSAALTNGILIDRNGNVGINTTNPSRLLTVATASSTINSVVQLQNLNNNVGTGTGILMSMYNSNSQEANYGGIAVKINSSTAGAEVGILTLRSTTGGALADTVNVVGNNVGIGTSTPIYKLQVNQGHIFIANGGSDNGNYYDDYIVSAGTTNYLCYAGTGLFGSCSSDARLKENIAYIDDASALQKVLDLKPATFDFKNGSKNQAGFIAQDVLPIIPEAVGNDSDGYYTLSTNALIGYTVGAVKEQQTEIDVLKQENAQLRSELDELKAAVRQLQAGSSS